MTLFSTNGSVQPACTTNVHRPMGGIEGLREPFWVTDKPIESAKALVWMACSQFGKMCLFLFDVVQGSSSLVFRY